MILTPPQFWHNTKSWLPYLLKPLSWLYEAGTRFHKKISKPYHASVPVISVGNLVLGGAGKTPVTIALANELKKMGWTPHIITRGYGGKLSGPLQVNPDHHSFENVGDEPLLLAKIAPTWISKKRSQAVPFAIQAGANILLLDDAHQNNTLKKDISIVVINALQGFGNGHVFPAGPLRQSVSAGLKAANLVIVIGQESLPTDLSSLKCPLIHAHIVPLNPNPCPVIAFTGIGYPEKFRQTLIEAGYDIKEFISFPDHYPFSQDDLTLLKSKAYLAKIPLITTEKDAMRLSSSDRETILTLFMRLEFEGSLNEILKNLLRNI